VSQIVATKTARDSLVETEHQLKDLGQVLKYAEQYKANHIYHVRYQKSKDKDAYLNRKLDNLNQYLDRNPEQQIVDKNLDKGTQSL